MSLLDSIRGRRQSAEDTAKARYRALIIKAAGNGSELGDRETAELDTIAAGLGHTPDDIASHLAAVTDANRLRPQAGRRVELKAARLKAKDHLEEVGKARQATIEKANAEFGVAEASMGQALEALRQAHIAADELGKLATAHPWLIEPAAIEVAK